MKFLKSIFSRKPKQYQLDERYKVVEAFKHEGMTYFQFDDANNLTTGRGLCALTIYEEFNMRCTREYLELHVRAMEKILNEGKKINLTALVLINQNLKERLNMALFPDHVYKLASVVFFDETESPYNYDYKYNMAKIERWKASGGMLDFFSRTPLKDLIPSLQSVGDNADQFFQVAELVDQMHRTYLREV